MSSAIERDDSRKGNPAREGICGVFSRLLGCFGFLLVVLGMSSLFFEVVGEIVDPDDTLIEQLLESEALQIDETLRETFVRPGERAYLSGQRRHRPVVIVPGIISTPLEIWAASKCARRHFRERIWGDSLTLAKLTLNTDCWVQTMMLSEDGLDPPEVRLRPATGLRSADVLIGGMYSLWNSLVQQLADLGYDEQAIHLASYDWRLQYGHLELRDRYFTELKQRIESMYRQNGRVKVVVLGHSMGANVFLTFLQWVHSSAATGEQCPYLDKNHRGSSEDAYDAIGGSWSNAQARDLCLNGSNGGPTPDQPFGPDEPRSLPPECDGWWAEKYVDSFVSIAGAVIGVPKTLTSIYSGEMKDTAELGPVFQTIKEQFLSRKQLREGFRTFRSMWGMLPMGGSRIWGGRGDGEEDLWAAPDQSLGQGPLHEFVRAETGGGLAASSETVAVGPEGNTLAPEVEEVNRIHSRGTTSAMQEELISMGSHGRNHGDGDAGPEWSKAGMDAVVRAAHAAMRAMNVVEAVNTTRDFVRGYANKWYAERLADLRTRSAPPPWLTSLPNSDSLPKNQPPQKQISTTPSKSPPLVWDVSQLYDLMRSQSPDYMAKLDRALALEAWRPPHQSELSPEEQKRHRPVAGGLPHRFWANPLAAPLPYAPSMKIYCLYGVGRRTERAYRFVGVNATESTPWESLADIASGEIEPPPNSTQIPWVISSSVHDDASGISSGVQFSDGDGTVPTFAMGFMCAKGWKQISRNPAQIPIITREFIHLHDTPDDSSPNSNDENSDDATINTEDLQHDAAAAAALRALALSSNTSSSKPASTRTAKTIASIITVAKTLREAGILRGTLDLFRSGGGQTSEHVDVLLNKNMLEDVLNIATSSGDPLQDRIHSDLLLWVNNTNTDAADDPLYISYYNPKKQ